MSIFLNLFVFSLLISSAYFRIFNKLNSKKVLIIDRAWWTSILILICFHATDIPSFDSRINILGWILLIGLRCMISKPKIDHLALKQV